MDTQIADQLAKRNHSEYKIRVVSILEVLFDLSDFHFLHFSENSMMHGYIIAYSKTF